MRKPITLALVVWAVTTLLACGQSTSGKDLDPSGSLAPSEVQHELVQSSNAFGLKLFDEVVRQSDGGNVFVSPLSVSMALGMAYNGARGSTAEGMAQALAYGNLTTEEVNQAYRDLIDQLGNLDPKVTMEIANSIWYHQSFPVLPAFIDVNRDFFDALVSALDFASPTAAATINAWVAEKTHDKIEEIVDDPIDPTLVMFLINAVYFKGTWTYEFEPDQTSDQPFLVPGAAPTTVEMMHLEGDLSYHETDTCQLVALPYGNGLFAMTILLPKAGQDIDDLAAQLTTERFDAWTASLTKQAGTLELPRFELDYETNLNEVLTVLGMGDAFLPGVADLSGISPGADLFISQVKHKSYVKVNEEGTEAAAVTAVKVGGTTSTGPVGFQMIVDRPFLFVIADHQTGATLFVGKIVNPPSS